MNRTPARTLVLAASHGLTAALALTAAAPAQAQRYYPPPPPVIAYEPAFYGDEIVVDGRYRRVPNDVQSLSQRVGYRDLDLYYAEDRRELRRRVSLTARDLCERLGETESSSIVIPSCRDAATRDALRRVGTVAEDWAPRDTAWVAPPRWRGPRVVVYERRYEGCGC